MSDETIYEAGAFVFRAGAPRLVGRSAGYFWFPTVTAWEDGTLLTTVYAGEDALTAAPEGLYLWSGDNGESWSEPRPGPFSEAALHTRDRDRLLLPFALRQEQSGHLAGPLLRADATSRTVASVGEATVTGFPRPLKPTAPDAPSGWAFNGQTLRTGDGSGYLATMYGTFAGDTRHSLILAESPDGYAWRVRSVVAAAVTCPLPGTDGPCESALVRLDDGRLLCLFRLAGVFENVFAPGSPLRYRPYARAGSSDDGRTWTAPESLPPHCASVQPCLTVLPDGGGLVLSGGRPGLWLWLCSGNDAERWDAVDLATHHNRFHPHEPIRTAEETTSYTEMAALPDGSFVLVYDRVPFGWRTIPNGSAETNSVWCVRLRFERRP